MLNHRVTISMNGKGRAKDNIMVECLWQSVKYEEVYPKDYNSVAELVQGLKVYFECNNDECPYQSFGNQTPAEVYWGGREERQAA